MKPSWIVLHHYVSGNNDSIAKQHRLAFAVQDDRCSYHYVVFTDGTHVMLNGPSKPKGHCGTNYPSYSKNKKTCNYNGVRLV